MRAAAWMLWAFMGLARAAPGAPVQPLELGPVSAYPGALAVSRDGRIAAHVDAAGAVKVWETANTLPLPFLPAGQTSASSVALSTDGSTLVVGHADGRLVLWKRGSPAPVREFRGHAGRILAVAISPDGSRLASGSADGTTQVFDLATGRRLLVLDSVYNGHPTEGIAAPVSVAFAGSRLLLTQDWQRRQYDVGRVGSLWDVEQGIELSTIQASPPNGDQALQAGMAVGGGGWLLAYTGMQQLMVQRLDSCGPARPVGRPKDEGMEGGSFADTVAADPLGRWIAATSNTQVHFFAAAGGRPPLALTLPGRALALAPLPDGQALLALLDTTPRPNGPGMTVLGTDAPAPSPAGLFRITVPAALLAAPPMPMAPDARPCPLDEAAQKRQQFALPDNPPALTVTARLSPALPPRVGEATLPLGPLQRLRFDARGQLFALYLDRGDTRAALAAWTLATGRPALFRELPRQGETAQPLWLGMDWAVSDGVGGWLRASTGQRLLASAEGVMDAQVAGDALTGRLYRIAGATVEQVTAEGQRLPPLRTRGPLQGIAASSGRLLAVYRNGDQELFGGAPLVSRVFRASSRSASSGEPDERLERLMLSGDGRFAHATADTSNSETPSVDVAWQIVDGKPVGTGIALAELPTAANRVVTADARAHRLAVWDLDRNEAIARLPRQRSRDAQGMAVLLKAAISDDGRRVASASPDGLVRVWDIDAHRLLGEARVGAEVTALAFHAAGRQLAVGRTDGQVWLLALP